MTVAVDVLIRYLRPYWYDHECGYAIVYPRVGPRCSSSRWSRSCRRGRAILGLEEEEEEKRMMISKVIPKHRSLDDHILTRCVLRVLMTVVGR